MPPPPKAQWATGRPSVTVDGSGAVVASVPLLDGGKAAGTLTFTMTADRELTVTWQAAAGAVPLAGFSAWSDV